MSSPTPIYVAVVDDDLLTMVPAEADLVLWADMAKLRTSPWTRDSFAKVVSADSGASEPEFDQIRDVERLVFAKVPALRDGASLLVAQGKFDRERMSKDFAKDGGAVEKSAYRGADMLVRGDEALAFLSNRTVISGLTVAVRTAIDCNVGVARSIDSDSWFQRLRGRLTRTKGTPPVAALYVQLQPTTREALLREMGEGEALEEFAGRIDLGSDLDVTAIGSVRTALQARDLAARLAAAAREARERDAVLLVLAGPAGSGKSTLCDRLVASDKGFARVVTSTTRPRRIGCATIKAETAKRPDPLRGLGPFRDGKPGLERSLSYHLTNAGKRGLGDEFFQADFVNQVEINVENNGDL